MFEEHFARRLSHLNMKVETVAYHKTVSQYSPSFVVTGKIRHPMPHLMKEEDSRSSMHTVSILGLTEAVGAQ